MKFIRIFLLACCIVSCASINVTYDYEKGLDFNKYKTYNYYSNLETGFSDLDTERLLAVLDDGLRLKGLSLSSTPDFFIDIQSSEFEPVRQNTVGVGLGGGGRNVGGGVSIGLPIGNQQANRRVVIEFIEEDGIGLFWQSVSESRFNIEATPKKKEECINAIVTKMLAQFPPK